MSNRARILTLFLSALLPFTCPWRAFGQTPEEIRQGYMAGQAVVGFKTGTQNGAQRRRLEELGLRVRWTYRGLDAFWVEFDRATPVKDMCRRLEMDPIVAYAQPNNLGRWAVTFPNDPAFGQQWALDNTGQSIPAQTITTPFGPLTIPADPGTADSDIDAPEAWDLITNATSTIIAICDSGCLTTHADLAANIWVNPGEISGNGVDDDGNGLVDDINGWDFGQNDNVMDDQVPHGTSVTSCAAAVGNDGIGTTGVCWQARALIAKMGDFFPQMAAVAAAIQYSAQMGAGVANISAGFGSGPFPVLQGAINQAQTAGMVVVVAAGNNGNDLALFPDLPASYPNPNIIVVGSSDNDDVSSFFSAYSTTAVHVTAPGENIWCADASGGWSYQTGTSFSAPIVTGCVALMRSFSPSSGFAAIRAALIGTSDVRPGLSGSCVANGRVNLFAALGSLVPPPASAPTPNPMAFGIAPNPIGPTTIAMTAVTATSTPGPVEYRFALLGGPSGGGAGAWQSSPTYTFNASPNTTYAFTVTARDSVTLVSGTPSAAAFVTTPAATPDTPILSSPSNVAVDLLSIGPNGNPPATLFALDVNGQYYDGNGGFSAVETWRTDAQWASTTINGLVPGTVYSVRAKALEITGSETPFGPAIIMQTQWLPPSAAGMVGIAVGGPFDVFSINGSTGGPMRRLDLSVGDVVNLAMAQPPISGVPSGFVLLAWLGIPSPIYEFPLSPSIGTLVFTPCPASPSLPTLIVASSFGPATTCPFLSVGPAPWSFSVGSFPFPLVDITFQGVIEESPGVFRTTNAMILTYR